jgi:hypothetical protein
MARVDFDVASGTIQTTSSATTAMMVSRSVSTIMQGQLDHRHRGNTIEGTKDGIRSTDYPSLTNRVVNIERTNM